jgi:hypothetical protein
MITNIHFRQSATVGRTDEDPTEHGSKALKKNIELRAERQLGHY